MPSQCLGRNRDNSPCSAWVPEGRAYCQWHDPARETERQQWRAKGGARRSNKARARRELADDALTLTDTAGVLSRMLRRLEAGDIEPNICTAAANIARAMATLEEKTTLADAIAELEARLGVGESA